MKKLLVLVIIILFSVISCDDLFEDENDSHGEFGKIGPGGGYIFFAEGGEYKECSGELGVSTWSTASTTASNFKGGGYTNWKLPTRAELDLMYKNLYKNNLGGFINTVYWSSEQSSSEYPYGFNINNGSNKTYLSTDLLGVRAVRSYIKEPEIINNTTLKINNQSSKEITDVIWSNVSFANNQYEDSIKSGTNVTKTVEPGGGYIFFKRKSNPIMARTSQFLVIEKDQELEFTFTDSTVIVELHNTSNTGMLSGLESTVVWWDDAEGNIQPYYERVSHVGYYSSSANLPYTTSYTPSFYTPKNGTKSIAIGGSNNAKLHLKVNLEKNAKLSFWYANKVNGTAGTVFSINETEKKKWTTSIDWSFIEFDLSSGVNDIIWQKNDGLTGSYVYYLSLDDLLIYYTE